MARPLSWVLRHTVLLVFLALILIGVFYRQAIFGPAAEDATAESVKPADTGHTASHDRTGAREEVKR